MFIASLLSGFSFNHGNTLFLYLKLGVSIIETDLDVFGSDSAWGSAVF